ncbi:MAG: winged helix-turn-helix transcriptional regulator [Planctomycetes bacterium]|nr:winged helix-turn-helix transcriptional regulator [Planctomycetota bacterium]MCB9905620.1 winged helix-turn-helix transcriptional regulator [Planctomycetota bacterium]
MDRHPSMLAGMDAIETADAVARLYPEVFHFLYRRRNPRAKRLRPESLALLRHLAATGPLTVMEAARHFDRSQSAISERLERLVKRGLLARIPDERDRRQHLVWLTDEGRDRVEEEGRVLDSARLEAAAGEMSEDDREALTRGLSALVAACATSAANRRPKDEDREDSV